MCRRPATTTVKWSPPHTLMQMFPRGEAYTHRLPFMVPITDRAISVSHSANLRSRPWMCLSSTPHLAPSSSCHCATCRSQCAQHGTAERATLGGAPSGHLNDSAPLVFATAFPVCDFRRLLDDRRLLLVAFALSARFLLLVAVVAPASSLCAWSTHLRNTPTKDTPSEK